MMGLHATLKESNFGKKHPQEQPTGGHFVGLWQYLLSSSLYKERAIIIKEEASDRVS